MAKGSLPAMRQLIVTQLVHPLTPPAGLAVAGHHLAALQPVLGRHDAVLPVKSGGMVSRNIVRSEVGLPRMRHGRRRRD